jgi:putative (di)nucleoside polyphosphate hydrolase
MPLAILESRLSPPLAPQRRHCERSGLLPRHASRKDKGKETGMGDDDHLYRRGVGVMLINADKQVWVGKRIDNQAEAWQMPQGGLDDGEDPWDCALRELEEETGIAPHLVEQLASHPERLRYRLPDELIGVVWKKNWVGQNQDWFLARFLGSDSDIDIATEDPEFREWKWVAPAELPELIVPFKRDMYRAIVAGFADWL